jgi:glycosyltransferase involved in cell wall biosynthesis
MRVALVHDWLVAMRGGERCLEALCELYPEADLYTLFFERGAVSKPIAARRVTTSALQRLPGARRYYRYLLPLFPAAIERFELRGYDVVISSSHCVAKGALPGPGACHIAYIHTPMRYIWDQYEQYFGQRMSLGRMAMPLFRGYLRRWDVASGARPHYLIANSRHVAERIRRLYGRTAPVIYPPVRTAAFSPSERDDGYYLIVSAFVPYKRLDLAIEAFNRLGLPMRVVGDGPDDARLRRLAGGSIQFLGALPDAALREQYAGCRALVFPGEEDFGIVPVEAMACGKAVIAYGRGGATESIVPLAEVGGTPGEPPTGILFEPQTSAALVAAVHRFEQARHRFSAGASRRRAEQFDEARFKDEMRRFVLEAYDAFRARPSITA